MQVTVCTLTRNRTRHLVNQVRGLLASVTPPAAQVVAVMGGEDPAPAVPDTPWPIEFVDVAGGHGLPLARARNVAVRATATPGVVLLDVDCVPAPGLVGTYGRALDAFDGILMGGVGYLPPGWDEVDLTEQALAEVAEDHPSRPTPPTWGELRPTDDWALFWSLSFAVRRDTLMERVGGFDEGYGGYGAEDTDLALRACRAGVPLAWLGGARAFHQHHETHDPPLQHVSSIVGNARRFRQVWGTWPMEGWLSAFDRMGLVRFDPDADVLVSLREPTGKELAAAHRPTALPRSSA